MKSLSAKTFQCGVTVQGLTTLSGTVYLTALTNTATWDYVVVGTTAQGQLYTRTYAQLMSDITSGIGLSGYVPTSRTLTINGVSYDLTANRSWTITTPYVSKLQHQVKAGVAINKGQAVYVTSADGTNMIVGLASNASEATSSKTMGLLDATVSTNGFANVVTEGLLAGLDTSTAGSEGDPVWLGTGGNLIYGLTNKPYAPAHLVFIGIVTRKNANNGEIFVKVQNGFELKEIHDVDLITSAPTAGQLLRYNSDGLWKNWSPNYLTAESDTLATVTSRGATTSTPVTFNGNVTLGNSADLVFQDLAGTFPTSGKGFDWTLNNDGARIYAIQPNSDSIDFVFQLRDNATTNDRFVFWVDEWQGPAFDKYPLIISGGTEFDLKDSSLYTNTVLRLSNSGVLQNVTGNISMFTNNVGYLTSYTETDTLSTVTGRGATTNTSITVGPDLTVQADGGVNYTASRLWLNSHNNYRGAGVHMSGVGSTWFAGTPYTDFDGGYVIARTGTSNDVSSAQYSNALLTVKSSGNVGIGTTNPSYKLDVVGEGKVTGKFRVGGAVMLAEPGTGVLLFGSEGGNQTAIYSASAEAIRINTAGLVGIGTTNPQYKLDVNGIGNFSNGFSNPSSETGYRLKFYDNGGTHNDAGIGLDGSGGGGEIMWFNALGGFYWGLGTGGTKMKLDSSGNLGIGTTSPASRFQSNNASTYNSSTPTGAILASNLAGGNAVIDIGVDATYLGYIQSRNVLNTTPYNLLLNPIGGNIGIGTTNPGGKLEVNTGGTSGWDKLVVTNTTLWGDGSTQYVTIGAGGATGIMMFNPHVVWNSASGTAALRLGRSGGVSSGSWYEVGTGASDSFFIAKDGFYQGPQLYINSAGNVGIGTTSPATKLDVNGVITATGGNSTNWNTAYGWGNHSSAGYVPQARTLTINGTSYDLSANRSWTIATTTPGGSNTQFQYNSSGTLAGASALIYNSTTNRVGINQASPGYDLDVNGQVRVQDKLRIGTGNGVVHMSSSATINASATTVVWAQTVSVGMCAFIEYYILNNNSLTDQRAGTIMVTWNQSGTPTITHTETTTPDIGSTTAVNFTSSLVGSDARINAVNSSANPYTMVMSYKYF